MLRDGGIGLGRGAVFERAVRALFVVVVAEAVELDLQFVESARGGLGGEPAFQGLVEAFDLALGLQVPG